MGWGCGGGYVGAGTGTRAAPEAGAYVKDQADQALRHAQRSIHVIVSSIAFALLLPLTATATSYWGGVVICDFISCLARSLLAEYAKSLKY